MSIKSTILAAMLNLTASTVSAFNSYESIDGKWFIFADGVGVGVVELFNRNSDGESLHFELHSRGEVRERILIKLPYVLTCKQIVGNRLELFPIQLSGKKLKVEGLCSDSSLFIVFKTTEGYFYFKNQLLNEYIITIKTQFGVMSFNTKGFNEAVREAEEMMSEEGAI